MRAYTLALSVVVHLVVVAAAIVVPLVATNELPQPRRTVEFISVTAALPPPPAAPRVAQPRDDTPANATPLVEPADVQPEIDLPPQIPLDIAAGSIIGGFGGDSAMPGIYAPVAPPVAPPPLNVAPVRVGGAITRPARTSYVSPDYPAIARSARKEGTVILEAVIDVDGSVKDVRVLRSVTLLDQAAIDAVRQWRFTPTRLNGEAVPVVMTVTVTFALQ